MTSINFFNIHAFSRLFVAVPGHMSINNQTMHMTTVYKTVLHDNGDNLGWSKNMKPNVLSDYERQSAEILCTQFFCTSFFLIQIIVLHIFWYNHCTMQMIKSDVHNLPYFNWIVSTRVAESKEPRNFWQILKKIIFQSEAETNFVLIL